MLGKTEVKGREGKVMGAGAAAVGVKRERMVIRSDLWDSSAEW